MRNRTVIGGVKQKAKLSELTKQNSRQVMRSFKILIQAVKIFPTEEAAEEILSPVAVQNILTVCSI
jgi:hypothetical protein